MRKENSVKFVLLSMFLILFVFLLVYLKFWNVVFLESSKAAARKEICIAYDFVLGSSSYQDAVSRIKKNRWAFIYYGNDEYQDVFVISAPVEFPGLTTQWRMFVTGKNGAVNRVDLKTVDGGEVHCALPAKQGGLGEAVTRV